MVWVPLAVKTTSSEARVRVLPTASARRLMGWPGRLELHYRRVDERTVGQDRHHGPLRVLKSLYPEGEGICHHVMVHPPGGVVGGDELDIQVVVDAGAHALITTPGATRFYRCDGTASAQRALLQVGANARLEWLPLENIAHPGCDALSSVQFELHESAEMIGWDLLALGLPAAAQAFDDPVAGAGGRFQQHLCWPGQWLEQANLLADDAALLDGAVGLAGQRAIATLWFASGSPLATARREALLASAREALAGSEVALLSGATAARPGLVLVRALAPRVRPLFQALAAVRAAWREAAWQLPRSAPRVWST
jgi:urease accessory protein